jgi:fumarate reductase subunit D
MIFDSLFDAGGKLDAVVFPKVTMLVGGITSIACFVSDSDDMVN